MNYFAQSQCLKTYVAPQHNFHPHYNIHNFDFVFVLCFRLVFPICFLFFRCVFLFVLRCFSICCSLFCVSMFPICFPIAFRFCAVFFDFVLYFCPMCFSDFVPGLFFRFVLFNCSSVVSRQSSVVSRRRRRARRRRRLIALSYGSHRASMYIFMYVCMSIWQISLSVKHIMPGDKKMQT